MTARIIVRDNGAAALLRALKKRQEDLTVGVHGTAMHAGGSGLTVAQIGAKNEFGIGVPQRSWLRGTLAIKRRDINAKLNSIAKQIVLSGGRITVDHGLASLGGYLVKSIRERIDSSIPPPNTAYTIKRKGSNVTLIDTMQLRNSISWKLKPSGKK